MGTEHYASVRLPIHGSDDKPPSYRFESGDFVYVSAQNNGQSGSAHCVIRSIDGTVISEETASGLYTIASCYGTAG